MLDAQTVMLQRDPSRFSLEGPLRYDDLTTFRETGDLGVIRAEYLGVLIFEKGRERGAFRFENAFELARWSCEPSAIPQERAESHG